MSKPELGNVYVDAVLSRYSISYTNGAFIADQVAPFAGVKKRSGSFYVFGMEAFYPEDDYRRPCAWANEVRWDVTTDTYSCEEHALVKGIADEIIEQEDAPIQARKRTLKYLQDKVKLNREIRVAALYTSGVFPASGALAAAAKWSNYTSATSVPLTNITTAKASVFSRIWRQPTHIIIPPTVGEVLALHPDVLDITKRTSPNQLTASGLPSVLRGLKVIEPTGGYTDSETDSTPTEIWGDNVIVLYIEPNPGLDTINTMTSFVINKGEVRRWRDDRAKADYIEYSQTLGEEIVCSGGAYIIEDVLA